MFLSYFYGTLFSDEAGRWHHLNEDNHHYTISSVAFDSGFSSLSSFNSAFKRFVGTTPSSYRKTKGIQK
mgnify:CR=1 FL=1